MKYDVLLWNCPPGRLSGCGAVSGFIRFFCRCYCRHHHCLLPLPRLLLSPLLLPPLPLPLLPLPPLLLPLLGGLADPHATQHLFCISGVVQKICRWSPKRLHIGPSSSHAPSPFSVPELPELPEPRELAAKKKISKVTHRGFDVNDATW